MLYPQNTQTRNLIDLSGIWNLKLNKNNEVIDTTKPLRETRLVAVPGSFNDQLALHDDRTFIGDFYYEKNFILAEDIKREKRVFLRFGSATHNCSVYLNGKLLGTHKGGFTPFEFEITEFLIPEENRLLVKLDNILDFTTLPVANYIEEKRPDGSIKKIVDENFDFFNYAGLHRPVKIYITNKNRIEDITITYNVDLEKKDTEINFDVEVDGKFDEVVVQLYDAENNYIGETRNGKFHLENTRLWEPLNAYLYKAKVIGYKNGKIEDTYTEEFGIRTVEVKDCKFLINGKPFYFKGFGRHEDTFAHGRGLNEVANIQDMTLMKWMGANSFRTSHYPYSEEMMRLADREGFIVIDEVPAVTLMYGFGFSMLKNNGAPKPNTWDVLKTKEAHELALKEMIKRDKNHACVVMWSVSNEAATHEKGAYDYHKPLFDLVRELDKQKRPVTYINIMLAKPEADEAMSLCDVICLNRYYSWYVNTADFEQGKYEQTEELKQWHKLYPDKPIMFTEYGADTVAGLHDMDFNTPFTEEFQVKYYEMNAEVFDTLDYFVGEQLWNFADFQTKYGIQRVQGNKKGIFTRERTPKMVAHEIRKRWINIPDFNYKK
ncbi:MAG: beta-glucuronidase [Fusobacterium sp.]|nr:beta-glucuronidase [Fusobacterium sp.]MDO5789575.1 beta-glucuronidase [Fusobacterium sp.]